MVWRDELVEQITGHVRHDYGLSDDLSAYDDISQLNMSIGDMLERIASNLADFQDPPFTYPRLMELARLENVDSPQNQALRQKRGIAYLRSVLDLTCVFESNKVFEDFGDILDALPAPSIKLEPLPWADPSELGALNASGPVLKNALNSLAALDSVTLDEALLESLNQSLSESFDESLHETLHESLSGTLGESSKLVSESLTEQLTESLNDSLNDSLNELVVLNQSLESLDDDLMDSA